MPVPRSAPPKAAEVDSLFLRALKNSSTALLIFVDVAGIIDRTEKLNIPAMMEIMGKSKGREKK